MADIVIRGVEVSESLDIIINGNKVGYSTNNGMTWKENANFVVLPEGYGDLIDRDELLWECPDVFNTYEDNPDYNEAGYSREFIKSIKPILSAE